MTSSPKIVGEEKGCGPCLALTTLLFHISLSLSLSLDQFGRCGLIFGKTVVADGEEVIMVGCFFLCLSLPKHCRRDTGRGGRVRVRFPSPLSLCPFQPTFFLSFTFYPLCSSSSVYFSSHVPLSFSTASHLLYYFPLSPLTCPPLRPSLLPSVYFISLPPSFSLLSLSPSPWFCRG